MRRTRAATVIQKYQRMCVEKKRYRQKQAAALAMQTILRAFMARQKYQAVRPETYRLLYYPQYFFCSNVSPCLSVAAAGAQGCHHPEAHPWLAGSVLVQALPRGHRLPAVLHSQDES